MFEALLLIIALVVFVGLHEHKNMWIFIVLYWFVLTVKNLFGLMEVI